MFHSFWLCYYVIKHGITMKGGTRFPFAVCGKKKQRIREDVKRGLVLEI